MLTQLKQYAQKKTQNTKPPTKTHVYPKSNTSSQERQQIPKRTILDKQSSRKMMDVSTPTKTTTSSQTDPTDVSNFIQVGASPVGLLIGTMQIIMGKRRTKRQQNGSSQITHQYYIY